MPLPLPNLDDLDWDDLMSEARTRIPGIAPEWTDFNASDPGITLVELFAYHVEALLYRANRIGRKHQYQMLRLVNGPDWQAAGRFEDDLSDTLSGLRRRQRAVTASDYEEIVAEALGDRVARVKCIPGRNLQQGSASASISEAPGDVSVVVVPAEGDDADAELLDRVLQVLDPVRLLGTRVHAVGVRYAQAGFRFHLKLERGAQPREVIEEARKRLQRYFHPLPDENGPGLPFGKGVHLSDVYALLDGIPGVCSVTKQTDSQTGRPLPEAVVADGESRRLRRNSAGELEAVILAPDELVRVVLDEDSFTTEWERPA